MEQLDGIAPQKIEIYLNDFKVITELSETKFNCLFEGINLTLDIVQLLLKHNESDRIQESLYRNHLKNRLTGEVML